MPRSWKARLPQSTVLRPAGPPAPPASLGALQLPELERHEWMALGALASGGLAVWTYFLVARGRTVEAATVGLLTAISTTVVSVIGHLNAPVVDQAERESLRLIVEEGVLSARQSAPPTWGV